MQVFKFIAAPFVVAFYMLLGTIMFQLLLYLRYGQPLFDNKILPGADFSWFADSIAIIRGPFQLLARAWHLWAVEGDEGIVVLLVGTIIAWTWIVIARRRHVDAVLAVKPHP